MRLHAKLLGNNPFCIFPIWLVYCTFKRTERIKYTLWTGLTQSNLENPGLWGLCYSAWDCRDAVCQLLHIPTTRTAETGLQVPKDPYRTGGWTSSAVQSCRMSIFSHPVQISQYGTISHLRCDSRQQITRIMVNGKKKTTKKQNRERCQVLTSVYFLSYHSLKLLPNALK